MPGTRHRLSSYGDLQASSKRSWNSQEDARLRTLVHQYGTTKWSVVAGELGGRTGKQCRERWHNHLDPNVKKGDWTEEEDELILRMQAELGNQWAKITKMLPGRTDNAVKNRWHSSMRAKFKKNKDAENSFKENKRGGRSTVCVKHTQKSKSKSKSAMPGNIPIGIHPHQQHQQRHVGGNVGGIVNHQPRRESKTKRMLSPANNLDQPLPSPPPFMGSWSPALDQALVPMGDPAAYSEWSLMMMDSVDLLDDPIPMIPGSSGSSSNLAWISTSPHPLGGPTSSHQGLPTTSRSQSYSPVALAPSSAPLPQFLNIDSAVSRPAHHVNHYHNESSPVKRIRVGSP